MTIRVGALRNRLTLEAPSETAPGGNANIPWTVQAVVWADMVGLSGANRSGVVAESVWRFTIRWRSDLTVRWRLGMGDKKYEIVSIVDPDGLNRELTILGREILA